MYDMSGIPNKMLPVAVEMLPEGYRRLEYLESTGTQWIDTGVNIDNDSEVNCTFESRSTEYIQHEAIFGTRTSFPNGITLFYPGATSNGGILVFTNSFFVPAEFGKKTSAKLSKTELKCGDAQYNNNGSITGEVNNMLLFCVNTNGIGQTTYPYYYSKARIYSFSISRNGQLQINLIPCLDDKDKPCMFDTVSHKPFYNTGTGEFLYRLPGDGELPAGYSRLEYLESTGEQCIDTGVKLSSESVIECSAALVNDSLSSIAVCGSYSDPDKYALFWHLSKQEGEDAPIGQFQETVWFGSTTIAEVGKVYRFKQTPGELWIDDELARARDVNDFSLDFSAALFGTGHSLGYFAYKSASRIYSFSISLNDQLQLNFIPCLDDKGVPCMFDTVTRRPFRNAATTGPDFLYG